MTTITSVDGQNQTSLPGNTTAVWTEKKISLSSFLSV